MLELLLAALPLYWHPDEPLQLDPMEIYGRQRNLVDEALTASEGLVGSAEIRQRPLLRVGDLLEFVPGLVATQHSGSGKANQYFLRGFNLDHGTDFATFVEGMPINMRTHGHGQGYSDINFVIPELVQELSYQKGPYYADVGDFSSAGSARFQLFNRFDGAHLHATVGENNFYRGVAIGGTEVGGFDLLAGFEAQTYDGPWSDIDEDVSKFNGMARVSRDIGAGRGSLTLLAYDNEWNSADQIPQRAVDSGLIDLFGSIDTDVGGESSRYSLSANWRGPMLGGAANLDAYWIDYELDLFSNFTYFLDDPVNGDEFQQFDERNIYGANAENLWKFDRLSLRSGLQFRYDDIGAVGLTRTAGRQPIEAVRSDEVQEWSLGWFGEARYRFTDRFSGFAGLRYDYFDFDVEALRPENSGSTSDDIVSLKGGLSYLLGESLELYGSAGQSFHSNDARGTVISVDPVSGESVEPVDPLVRSRGGEIGARWFVTEKLHATAAVWTLDLDSELLFVGDAGNTEATRPSERVGVEAGLYAFFSRVWSADVEVSYTDVNFEDDDPAGDEIPGAIPLVVSAGLNAAFDSGWFGNLRVRHFGDYPLIEDDSVRADSSTMVNARIGKRFGERFIASIDIFNILNSEDRDIEYFYASRLPGEPAEGIEDRHFHVFEPRMVRVNLEIAF